MGVSGRILAGQDWQNNRFLAVWLSDILSLEHPAKLDLEEIEQLILLGRDASGHCAGYRFANDTRYQPASKHGSAQD